jgi:hypothetical protein
LKNVAAFGFDLQPDADITNNKLPAREEHAVRFLDGVHRR